MRTSKNLPSPAVKLKRGCLYGFGYNECDDDYKVVGIFRDLGNENVYKSVVKIYSLRTDSWKRSGDFEGGFPLDEPGKFASGKLHFVAKPKIDYELAIVSLELAIVSLDLKSESYDTVELPNCEKFYSDMFLGVLGGCICVTLNYQQIHADVWVLKEYDFKGSWTKVASIPYVDASKIGFMPMFHPFYSSPLLMLPHGEILLVFDLRLVIYNPKNNCFRRAGTSNIDRFLEADTYVESLVSLQLED